MAKVKVDIKDLTKSLKKFGKEAKREARRSRIGQRLKSLILQSIRKGLSPVKNQGRYAPYSASYKAAIRGQVTFRSKRKKGNKYYAYPIEGKDPNIKKTAVRPVNLKNTGKMLKSLFVKVVGNATSLVYEIGFSDAKAAEIAGYHNKGTGKMPKRQILPTGSKQTFSRPITSKIRKLLLDAVDRVAKRQS